MWRVKYPTLFCYKLLDLCLVHLRKCLFQLWFSSNKATAVITYMYEFRHWSTNGEKPSQCTVEQVGVHSFQYLDVNGTTTQTGADESPGFWNGFTTSESSVSLSFPRGQRHRSWHLWRVGWSPFDQLLAIYPGFYKAGYHSMSSSNPLAGLVNCSAHNNASLVMGVFMEVANDQLRYIMTFW